MVGIVLVTHSAELAESVLRLAQQMTQGKAPIAVAGGIDDPNNPFGTDAMRVLEAIKSVYSEEGVVVLMDLGSALMSAEMALEFLPEEKRSKVVLCDAPLVEGAIAAAVQSVAGADLQRVVAEARGALSAKAAQLQPEAIFAPAEVPVSVEQWQEIRLVVRNRLGLHARPAAQFVSTASQFQASITVRNLTRGTGPVNAKSINQVATLGVRQGHEIAISASGRDAEEALVALRELVESGFGELEEVPEPLLRPAVEAPPTKGELKGIAASPGIAIGPAFIYRPTPPEVPRHTIEDPNDEWQRLQEAIKAAKEEIKLLRTQATARIGGYEAAIFDAHLLFLEDPALVELARQHIFQKRVNAEAAWKEAIDETVASYEALDDPYLKARAIDVADVGQRVLRLLAGVVHKPIELPYPSVLVAVDLTPSDTAQLDPSRILGICTERGGATSHSAILARALGIPAVVGVGPILMFIPEGATLALDGHQGRVWVNPPQEVLSELEEKHHRWLIQRQRAKEKGQRPAVTKDGCRIEVVANIGGLADARIALEYGAEGVGLLRTEFLYLDRKTAPTEEEQLAAYFAIAEVMGQRPLVIRTLDIGGDKPLPYLKMEHEPNPFLGCRGVRLYFEHPQILKTQLRAILRASPGHNIKIMFPMVASISELRKVREILEETKREMREEKIPFNENIEVGIMVEIPSAALMAEHFANEVDFFSIGTNDLSQYTMAADRTNARVSALADAFNPAVLRLIHQVIEAAHAAGIWVGVCGEIAGNPLAVPLLVGLGVDELSVNPPFIPEIKQIISFLTMEEARAIALEALKLRSPEEVREYVTNSATWLSLAEKNHSFSARCATQGN